MTTASPARDALQAEFPLRARGALYGLILGDIIGAYFEFSSRGRKELPTLGDLAGKTNVFGIRFGYTDDSILALLGMESLVDCAGRWDTASQRDHARRYMNGETAWSPNGRCFDIGISTLRSLRDGEWAGKRDARSAGNGVLMKHLPFVIGRCLHPDQEPVEYYRQVADLTHGCPSTVTTAREMGLLLERLLQGLPWSDAHAGLDTAIRHETLSVERTYSGFCEDSWVLALQLVQRRFKDDLDWTRGIQCIMDLGGDTDTNAAIYGQLYGALFPAEIIAQYEAVRAHVHRAEDIDALLERLLATGEGVAA
ncbi:MAG: ADP-ribosylglycohydrolase family protein [Moraxellaceae bacterium]|jgi:ADP-ribosyl-[dinitrogen reductase] hydrolase|nr:ADP-ribosylglycohydrolase family protein [Moraxellaceae bacterium]